MKKIISLGIASAVCALTAISASAASTQLVAVGEVANGKQITVDLVATQDVKDISFVVKAEGLKVESVANKGQGLGNFNATTNKFAATNASGNIAKAGDTICTMTFTVTAENGSNATLTLEAGEDKYAAVLPEGELKLEVKGATASTSEPTSSGTTSSGTTSSGTTSSGTTDPGTNPPTGVGLAVVPAVLAAAGVIVAKKRK